MPDNHLFKHAFLARKELSYELENYIINLGKNTEVSCLGLVSRPVSDTEK
jgi:hypothetical protein